MARKAVQNAENRCIKKFAKYCVDKTQLFRGYKPFWESCKVDIYTETTEGKSYIVELKQTRKYDINYMRYYGALMEKDKLNYLKINSGEWDNNMIVGGMYLRFLKDGWMCWDVNDITTLSEDNKQRKEVKVSTRMNNVKKTPYWLLDWHDAKYIYNYDGVDMKQLWLDEEEWQKKFPKLSEEEWHKRLRQHKIA